MTVVGVDAKSFTRDKVTRDATGKEVSREIHGGYRTHLGTAVEVNDFKGFKKNLEASFAAACSDFGIQMRVGFASSQAVRKRFFRDEDDKRKYVAFLYRAIEGVQNDIRSVRFTWLQLPPNPAGIPIRGGKQPKILEWVDFHETAQTFGSLLAASDYVRYVKTAPDRMFVDHFASRHNYAWRDLTTLAKNVSIVPWGDEVNPIICAADLLATLTDIQLSASYKQLRRQSVQDIWAGRPFSVEAHYWTDEHLDWMVWRSKKTVPVNDYYPRPMVYALTDNDFLGADANQAEGRFQDTDAAKPYLDIPLLEAQRRGTGFKFFSRVEDLPHVKDGDMLVTLGAKSAYLAANLATAHNIEVLALKDLRARLAALGMNVG